MLSVTVLPAAPAPEPMLSVVCAAATKPVRSKKKTILAVICTDVPLSGASYRHRVAR
jgi:hypothetical protein